MSPAPLNTLKRPCCTLRKSIALSEWNKSLMLPYVMTSLSRHVCKWCKHEHRYRSWRLKLECSLFLRLSRGWQFSLPIGTASPQLFHTLQKKSGRAKVCALCIEKKKRAPSGRGKETTYKCKQCDLLLCRVGCFLEYHKQRNVKVQN
jgi:hypothetical protein